MGRRYTEGAGKKAWQYAGPDCPNPDCDNPLYGRDENGVPEHRGTIAHIHGLNEGSARYLESQSDDERKAFTNLIVLCPDCSNEIDGQGAERMTPEEAEKKYPAEMIKKWKDDRVSLVIEGEDMGWVRYPQGAVLFKDGLSISFNYWTDRDGNMQLLNAEQSAQVAQLKPLAISIREISGMLAMLAETEGKPADPSHQTQNDGYIYQLYKQYEHLPKVENAWLGYFTETLLLAQDVTLGEFLTMVAGQPPEAMTEHFERGREMLKEKAAQMGPNPRIEKAEER